MKAINAVLAGLSSSDFPPSYYFDDNFKLICSLQGKVVSVVNHELTEHNINQYNNGTKQAYLYFKDLISRGITSVTSLPSFLLSEPHDGHLMESTSTKTKIIIDCIRNEFTEKLSEAAYEILSDRVCNDYQIYHQNNNVKYPSDMLQLSKTYLRSFIHERIAYWKYNINRLLDVNHCDENEVINSIFSCDVSSELNTVSKLIESGKFVTVNHLLYRGGSLYEIERAKKLMLGQPCFDIKTVKKGLAVYGKGLYTSAYPVMAKKYCRSDGGGVMLEITLRKDNKYFEFQDQEDYNPLFLSAFESGIRGSHAPEADTNFCPVINDTPHPLVGSTKHNNISLIRNAEFIKKIKVFDATLETKIDLNLTPHEISNHNLIPKRSENSISSKITETFEKRVIDPLTSEARIRTVYITENKLPLAVAQQRNRSTEIKCYIKDKEDQWLRVKPKFQIFCSEAMANKPFAITYTKKPGIHQAKSETLVDRRSQLTTDARFLGSDGSPPATGRLHKMYDDSANVKNEDEFPDINSLSISDVDISKASSPEKPIKLNDSASQATTLPPGTSKSAPPASVSPKLSIKRNCDICLDNCNPGDAATVRTSDDQLRHQECHAHALNYQKKSRAEDVIKGKMSWHIEKGPHVQHIEQCGSVGQGVITVHFDFAAPPIFDGKSLPSFAQQKSFSHYMPNSLIGRQILKALQTAFNKGKVVTIAHSHTTKDYGLCFNIHLKTSRINGTPHGYPCDNWQQSLIDGLLAAGIDVNLDEQNPALTAATLYLNQNQ